MEPYIVSARKYRPQEFKSVVGQSHITNTLENAISNNHLAQALLFCGPRGVGKTTCARILAKKINEADGINVDDLSLNVFELDAASNNSVDDIRHLIDQVRFAPQVGKYKVYIIDEVHMLSQQAFNAFLKTLEEPPAHAIFILATTEKHKIIPTILSRCQIFDFKRITVDDIAGHLAYVAEQENIQADQEGLHIIAQKADGALRDALSTFDRLASYNNALTYQSVIENLDILDYDYFFKATDFIVKQDLTGLLLLFNEVLEKGFEGHQFSNGLATHFRDLLVSKDPQTIELLDVGPTIKNKYLEQAKKCQMGFLVYALRHLNDCDIRYKNANNQRLLVEVTLMQIVSLLEKKKASEQPVLNKNNPTGQIKAQPKQKVTIAHPPTQPSAKTETATKATPSPATPHAVEESAPKLNTGNWRDKLKGKATGISINNTKHDLQNEKETVEKPEEPQGPTEVFSDAEFKQAYKDFLHTIGNQKSVLGILNAHKPVLKNLTEIHYTLENKTQQSYLQGILPEMLQFLRNKLNNYSITVETTINKQTTTRKPYTVEERFVAMAKINPNLEAFRKEFEMDIE